MEVDTSTPLPYAAHEGFVTVSVDDGHPSDLRAAELLARLDYSATFYVPARNAERQVMDVTGVQRLAESFELGAHTYNHLVLPALDDDRARLEIEDGKAWLEDAASMRVSSFCYPRGKFNRRIADLVSRAGFIGARTTMGNIVTSPANVFVCGATTQAFSSEHGGIAHLWFHSWELDKYDQWARLEQLLLRLKARYQFRCVTNGYLFARYSGSRMR
jgi:peptidoglycan/xylan/chitin deacetylase (PgdA/CDA1 family)